MVSTPSSPAATSVRRSRGPVAVRTTSRMPSRAVPPPTRRSGTKSTRTARPTSATAKETTKIASYPRGSAASNANAASGPIAAPSVSSARCTPNDRPSMLGSEVSAISASRGAVRNPLPSRSAVTTAVMAAIPLAASIAIRLAAETPYPTTAIHLGRRLRSPEYPPRIRTKALTPWYTPSTKPYARSPMPISAVRYSGRTALTISEETSVSRLTMPRSTTVPATRRRTRLAGVSRSPVRLSRTEMYTARSAER